jgi:hypothetical protein
VKKMKTMNRILFMMSMLGLTASLCVAQAQAGKPQIDCRLFFPAAHVLPQTKTLEAGVMYAEAWEQGAWGPPEEFFGYVFLKQLHYNDKTFNVVAGVTSAGVITSVKVIGLDGADATFLAQFRGRSAQDNFDVARTPEDLLFLPVRLRAMQGKVELSERIALEVKAIAVSAGKLVGKNQSWHDNDAAIVKA